MFSMYLCFMCVGVSVVSSVDTQNSATAAAGAAQQGAAPSTAVAATATETNPAEAAVPEQPPVETQFTGYSKSLWFDYNEFVKCFRCFDHDCVTFIDVNYMCSYCFVANK